MNLLHLKYAVEVEKTASITQAATNLYMNQPHLSKAIRELEKNLNITIFNRTSKGVIPTNKGKEFLSYAKKILEQIDEIESLYTPSQEKKLKINISVPRASYVSFAFIKFIKTLDITKKIDINYRETNSNFVIKNIIEQENNLGIIRYLLEDESYYLNLIKENNLKYEYLWDFKYLILISKENLLSNEKKINNDLLKNYTEIIYGDSSEHSNLTSYNENIEISKNKISIYDRASQFGLLRQVPTTFMQVSPLPCELLTEFSLIQKTNDDSKNIYRDIIIYKKNYKLTNEDTGFINNLKSVINNLSK